VWKCGASLAHHGLLGSVTMLGLYGVNLSQVPAHHLASLVSCVTNELHIHNVRGCDLGSILSSVKCNRLDIRRQRLGREETLALVQAMESGVEGTLVLCNVDLSPVPAHHLASLASCVTSTLCIRNVSGCDLGTLLTFIKCQRLQIKRQSLGREETQALVQAMESHVEKVELGFGDSVTLDIEALTEYSGQGVCSRVVLWDDTVPRYREEMRTWASSRNWRFDFYKTMNLSLNRNNITSYQMTL